MLIECKRCGDILDTDIEAYMKYCKCKAIAYDWMRGGGGRYRIIGNKEDIEWII